MRYLLASDFDGTLLRKKAVSEEDRLALKEWQAQGHIFCLCSGRSPKAALAEMEKWGLAPDLLITSNGASAIDMAGTLRFQHPFPVHRLPALLERAHIMDYSSIHLHDEEGKLLFRSTLLPEYSNITREEAETIPFATQFGATFKGQPEKTAAFTQWVLETFPDVMPHVNGFHIDCTVKGVDKATGVAEAAKLFGVELQNCYTIGDNRNDLAMLLPYHGAVVESGRPEVIEKVGKSVPSVAAFIQEILKKW